MPAIGEQDQLGLSFRFEVVVDGFDLGSWASCHGLGDDRSGERQPQAELGASLAQRLLEAVLRQVHGT